MTRLMGTWFRKPLGDAMLAFEPLGRIEAAFGALRAAGGVPVDTAVFTRHDSEGRLHCQVTAYFSPAAAGVAQVLAAEPCAQPSRRGLDLLVGDPRCWPVLFPEDQE